MANPVLEALAERARRVEVVRFHFLINCWQRIKANHLFAPYDENDSDQSSTSDSSTQTLNKNVNDEFMMLILNSRQFLN